MHNVVVQVINYDVHDESNLVIYLFLGDVGNALLELAAPILLDIQRLALVLLGFQVLVEESLQLLPLRLLSQALFSDGGNEPIHIFGDRVLLSVNFRRGASSAFHLVQIL